jgi:peptidoglycan/LPS O-acetylase OafA/YrhL
MTSTAGATRTDWRPDITGLRGLAVVLVVAYHLQLRGAGGGFIGVDVFFVISGYLMTRIIWDGLAQDRFSYGAFIAARAARIGPALGVMVGVLLVLAAWLLPPFDLEILARQSMVGLVFWSNHFFHDRAGYNTHSVDTNWLLHTWSLSIEWQFYVLYPFVLMALARWGRTRGVALAGVGVLLLTSFACHALLAGSRPQSAFFLLPARAWELLAGGCVYFLANGGRLSAASRRWMAHAGLALVLGGALWLAWRRVPAVGASGLLLLPVGGTCLLLWAHDDHHPVLAHRVLQALGRWSYSIYLWHWPLIVALRMTDAFHDHPRLAAAGVAVVSVVAGALSYRWVECYGARGWRRLRRPGLALGGAAVLATWAVLTGGWSARAGEGTPHADYRASVRAAYYPDRCSNFMKTVQEMTVCSVTKGPGPRILVIGDSHAEQLYPWFVAHSAVSVDFYTQAECPPVPNFERTQSGFHCRSYAAAAWQKAATGAHDTVVLAAYWPNIGLNGAPYCHAREGAACAQVQGPAKQALVRRELKAAIETLLAQGKTVVMLAPTPEARVRVPERIERERFWFGEVRLQIDERSLEAQAGWLAPLFDELRPLRGFHLVSLNDKLCAGYDSELKRPVYIDENHFDPVWIARHGGVLAPFVQRR